MTQQIVKSDQLSEQQFEYIKLIAEIMEIRKRGEKPLAFIRTYGCQQNVADSEKIKGMLEKAGFGFVDAPDDADFILFNTCAVREHAEDRVFGNVGALKNITLPIASTRASRSLDWYSAHIRFIIFPS